MNDGLLAYYVDRARRGLITNGILNCHVEGLHSIVVEDRPEGRIRLFYADKRHQLYRNGLTEDGQNPFNDMSLAYHRHRMDITLVPVLGRFTNITATFRSEPQGPFSLFDYKSKILTGTAGMEMVAERAYAFASVRKQDLYRRGDAVYMHARAQHTIHVDENEEAGWFVLEGQEQPGYETFCFSTALMFDATRLYKPMTQDDIVNILSLIKEEYK